MMCAVATIQEEAALSGKIRGAAELSSCARCFPLYLPAAEAAQGEQERYGTWISQKFQENTHQEPCSAGHTEVCGLLDALQRLSLIRSSSHPGAVLLPLSGVVRQCLLCPTFISLLQVKRCSCPSHRHW